MSTTQSLLAGAALAFLLPIGTANAQGLANHGPLSPDNGFPEYYEDNNGLRLGPCLNNSGMCVLDAPVNLTNPGAPFPDNYGGTFPDEFFWSLIEANLTGPGGESGLLVIGVEGSFGNAPAIADGDQLSFARIRIRATGLTPGANYVVTTPAGTFQFVATADARNINFTDDVGLIPGDFTGALNGSTGPFFMWDSDLPVTDAQGNQYIGNPNIPHTITGSPSGTNLFRIQGPGLNMSTDLFSVQGLVVADVAPPAAPVANFAAAPLSGTEPLLVSFTDLSTGNITSRSWSFGDGTGSALQNPTHSYAAGTYTVSLSVTGPGGTDTNTIVNLIAVAEQPPPPGDALVLGMPVPGVAGVRNTFVISGATPGRVAGIYSGLALGANLVNLGGCGGIPIGLNRPFRLLGRGTANAAGIVTIAVPAPAATAGRLFHFQAVEPFSCRTSSIVSDTF